MEIQVIRFSFSVSDIMKKTFWHRKVRKIFADSKKKSYLYIAFENKAFLQRSLERW